jgi:hypothetical protein
VLDLKLKTFFFFSFFFSFLRVLIATIMKYTFTWYRNHGEAELLEHRVNPKINNTKAWWSSQRTRICEELGRNSSELGMAVSHFEELQQKELPKMRPSQSRATKTNKQNEQACDLSRMVGQQDAVWRLKLHAQGPST